MRLKKIECRRCGVDILIETAKGHRGYCVPCFRIKMRPIEAHIGFTIAYFSALALGILCLALGVDMMKAGAFKNYWLDISMALFFIVPFFQLGAVVTGLRFMRRTGKFTVIPLVTGLVYLIEFGLIIYFP